MPSELYKGYIEVRGKKSLEKYKGLSKFKTYEQVESLPEFAGVLAENTIFVDLDDGNQAEILMNIVEDLQLDCRVIDTTRGKHFIFRNTQLKNCPTHAQLAIGLTADIKVGFKGTYEVLKRDGVERFVEWDAEEGHDYQEIPKWLFPVKTNQDFLTMDAGDGRNQALFNYILTLQSSGFTVEECRECITLLNRYVLKEPLSDSELEVILRDDAFKKPIFFDGNTLLHEKFAEYLKNAKHIVRINGQLHIYKDGIYVPGYRAIESEMIQLIPHLRDAQRKEVLKYLELNSLGSRFDTASLAGKLANLGDDIAGMYIEDTSIFKKVVTGDTIKAEEKGQKPFQFNPYCTLVFSANDIPRTKDRTGAVLRRLVIIPFNATFSKDDPDYNPHIREDLKAQECIEYFIRLSIEGLKRVIANKAFTNSSAVQKQKDEYERENNPVLAFIDDVGEDAIINKPCNDVHYRYQLFCTENGYRSISTITFSKSINAALGTHSPQRYKNGKRFRIFEK